MAVIRSLQKARLLAASTLPAAASLVRPQFVRPAAGALAVALGLLLLRSWPLMLFFAPALLLACRYYELSRYRLVRTSRCLLLLIPAAATASLLWTLSHRAVGIAMPLQLVCSAVSLLLGGHLWATQRRLQQEEGRRSWANPLADEYEPIWALGGLLAIMPVLFLIGFASGVAAWRSPLLLLWGLSSLGLLALQLRQHRRFPRAAMLWLVAWFAIETKTLRPGGGEQGEAGFLSVAVLFVLGALALYLEFHPRVLRTFRPGEMAGTEALPARSRRALTRRQSKESVPA